VALSIETCLFVGIIFRKASIAERPKLAQSAVLGIAGAALVFFWMDTNQISRRLATVLEVSRLPEVGLDSRKAAILDSLHILRDHPWLGTGLGSFEVAYPGYQSLSSDATWDHADCDFAEVLAETGLVGALLVAAAIALFLRLAFADLRARLRVKRQLVCKRSTIGRGDESSNDTPWSAKHRLNIDRSKSRLRSLP